MGAVYSLGKWNHRFEFEVTGFYFKLNSALVQRRDLSGADYFTNAGDVRQKGIESQIHYRHMASTLSFFFYLFIF